VSSSNSFDVIVIGAGHNGLTAAGLLAKSGRKVLVLEKRPLAGGIAAGEEFHPGYRTQGLLLDTSGVRQSVTRELGLEKHGLKFLQSEPPVLIPQENGPGLLLHADPDRAAAELKGDAKAYAEFRAFLTRIRPLLRSLLDSPPPSVLPEGADLFKLLKAGLKLRLLGETQMLEMLRIAPMCVADWLNERFENPLLKVALAAPALHGSYMGPWSAGTVVNFLLRDCAAEAPVKGGPAALARALEAAVKAFGGEIRCNAAVKSIVVKDGKITGVKLADGAEITAPVVVSSCDPKLTLFGLVAPADLPMALENQVRVIRMRGTTAKVNLALSGPLEFAGRPGVVIEAARTGEHLDDLERAFDTVKYKQFSKRPMLEIRLPSISEPGLAPNGHQVAEILVHFAPYDLAGGWTNAQREALGDAVVAELARYAPKLKSLIVARQTLTPADLEERYGLTGGHIYHGEHALDQLYAMRPSPDLARYATPVTGLFLAGSGSHPGGGITCAPGALAARAVLKAG
jgi:phytoene dehydrogenase-like protein